MEFGCSSYTWETKNGLHLLGRTYDQFGDLAANQVLRVPGGSPCAPELRPEGPGSPGRYGYTGMAVLGFGEPILVDGVNDAGLMGALLHYPEYAAYPQAPGQGKTAVHPGRLLAWLLSRCATLEEAVEALSGIDLVDREQIEGKPLSTHYLLGDKSGEAVVLEPDREGLHIHRDTIGVLTNSPGYLWHRTNLRAYVGVTNLPKGPQYIGKFELRELGERLGGGFGLPGDYSSPSRFVRLAFLKEFSVRGEDEVDGISRMFRAFAPVDIPEGLIRAASDSDAYEQTLCISVLCAESGTYYFAPSQNRRISAIRPSAKEPGIQYFPLGNHQDIDYRN